MDHRCDLKVRSHLTPSSPCEWPALRAYHDMDDPGKVLLRCRKHLIEPDMVRYWNFAELTMEEYDVLLTHKE